MTPVISEISLVVDLVGIFYFELVVYPESFMRKESITIPEISIGDIYWISGIWNICWSAWRSDIGTPIRIGIISSVSNRKIRNIGCE